MAILQPWISTFSPYNPVGLRVPVWLSLRHLGLEYPDMARQLAKRIGILFEVNYNIGKHDDPKFFVALEPTKGRAPRLLVTSTHRRVVEVLVDCDNNLFRCYKCVAFTHFSDSCLEFDPLSQQNARHATTLQRSPNLSHNNDRCMQPTLD